MNPPTTRGRPTAHEVPAEPAVRGSRGSSTRDRYLNLARQLANGLAGTLPSRHFAVAHITIADVARAAGVSRSALYRLWPSQMDFWNDLVDFVLRHLEDDPPPSRFTGAAANVDGPVDVSFEAVLDAAQDALLSAPLPLLRAGALGYPQTPPIDANRERARRDLLTDLAQQIVDQLVVHHRRCIHGVTATDLAAVSVALGNGLAITGRMVPTRDLTLNSPASADRAAPRSLLGALVGAVCRAFTVPNPAGNRAPEHSISRPSVMSADGNPASIEPVPSARRRQYLRIAASLALDTGTHVEYHRVLGHVSLDSLARAAKVTRRTLTNVWADQAQFRLDLFAHLLNRERQWVEAAIRSILRRDGTPIDSHDAFSAVGDRIHADLLAHADEVSFLAYAPVLDQREVSERALQEHDRHVDRCERQLRVLLVALDRRPVRGISLRHLAVALFTLADGTNRLVRTHRELLRERVRSRQGEHSITGYATAAIFDQLTEPLDDRRRVNRLSSLLS
jgi:AcrR family transcriptional regulator